MGTSIVGLAQGIPFFQMGQDILRSKSLDRNSYDSGDWFNRVDWTYAGNNFAVPTAVTLSDVQASSAAASLPVAAVLLKVDPFVKTTSRRK